jgi:hypothetical protein
MQDIQQAGYRSGMRRSIGKILAIAAGVLVVGALVAIVVIQQLRIRSGLSEEAAAKNVQDKVAKIMVLPGEDALVSDIENVDEVKSQAFFNDAQNGDKVLIFVQAAKIVIYREKTNQIVNAGPIVDDRTTTTTTDGESAE